MDRIDISIIIPAYNESEHIVNCLKSIIGQKIQNIEVLVVDDGSDDDTVSICEQLALNDNRIRIFKQSNGGVSVARNRGIDNACGLWLMFVDADDELLENSLQDMLLIANRGQSPIIQGCLTYSKEAYNLNNNSYIVDSSKVQLMVLNREKYATKSKNMSSNIIESVHGTCGKLFNIEFLRQNNIKYIIGLGLGEDILFYFSALEKCKKVIFFEKNIYKININLQSSTRKCNKMLPFYTIKFSEYIINYLNNIEKPEMFYDEASYQIYVHINVTMLSYFTHSENKQSIIKRIHNFSKMMQNDTLKKAACKLFTVIDRQNITLSDKIKKVGMVYLLSKRHYIFYFLIKEYKQKLHFKRQKK